LDWQIISVESVLTQLQTYADNSPLQQNLNQMAEKAAALPGISHVSVSYSDTAIQYRHDRLYCQIVISLIN
jgi:allophanate hydrolase subunit 1